MKLGCLTAMFSDKPLDQVLEILRPFGLGAVEIGAGNYPGSPHLDVEGLLASKPKREELKSQLKGEGLIISALSCHGNCLHPDAGFAKSCATAQTKAIKLAGLLGVGVVNDFAGCPGDSDSSKQPNWVTCAWPPDYLEVLEWQWEKKVIPYWKKQAKFAADNGVKIGFEMHPGFVVYNTETLLKIRKACGNSLGANFDPSHLFWQGMDPIACVRKLGKAIYHVHAKDSRVDPFNTAVNGVLDTKHYGDEINRSWIFRTVGYGHGREWWNDFVSTLRLVGYDGVISIEHEDSLMSNMEGLSKAVALLKQALLFEKVTAMTWA
ncbi:MAG TPA: sugar phosphate isomerase/epimerase [Candidatus Hydrogenedentes bacterium]|nr:sugar phosphate isomerase/epimerase [Candidatus Hydrogenedentota bacterium]HPG69903.1 sugar phosphate isomerase/epimerase [Candidatus Hydrogenedentota bacterium]